jgi:ABC-2 type transport system ATP-binding protein
MTTEPAIAVRDLRKSYGTLEVLRGVTFSVARGQIMALLGPNGAGKTTTIRILATLLTPDSGDARIEGADVVREPARVRSVIGLTGQFAAVDEYLTGRENLEMIGRLYRLSVEDTQSRSERLLQQFDLVDAGGRPVKTYSGGMRRRLDLAMSVIAAPSVLFLDEPTTGLDPRSRLALWDMIKALAAGGTSILLTTQYMDEADHLADEIIVMDHGTVIASGMASDLKRQVGADRLTVSFASDEQLDAAVSTLSEDAPQVDRDRRTIAIAAVDGARELHDLLGTLQEAGVEVETASLGRPTLDDVFLALTGHGATDGATGAEGERGAA